MNYPKITWTQKEAEKIYKLTGSYPPSYKPPAQPKLSDKEEAALRIQEQSFRGLPVSEGSIYPGSYIARTDSSITGEYARQLAQQKEVRAKEKEQRDITKFKIDYKKSLLELQEKQKDKETDYQKELDKINKEITGIDQSLNKMIPVTEQVEPGEYRKKKTLRGEEIVKPALSSQQKNKLLSKRERLEERAKMLERQVTIREQAKRIGITEKELSTKLEKAESIVREVYANQAEMFGLYADPVKRKQAMIEYLNQRLTKDAGMDLEDFNTLINELK